MPANTSLETETLNAGETPISGPNAPSDGTPPNNPDTLVPEPAAPEVTVAPESPIEPNLALGERWEREQAEQDELQRQLEYEDRMRGNRHIPQRPRPQPTQQMIETARALGLDSEHWSEDKIVQFEMLFKAGTIPVVTGVLLIQGLDSIQQCQKAYEVLGNLGQNPDAAADVRVAAYKALAETVKAHCAMSAHALSLAKETDLKKKPEENRTLPPALAFQMNFPPGSAPPQIKVASVNTGQPE